MCGFYRAMLCISAAYAVMQYPSVCLSVCPSVMFVYSVEMNKDIFNCFSPSGSHTILVFPHQTLWQYSDGDPLTGASSAGEVGDTQPIPGFVTDRGKLLTLVAGKRRRLFLTGDDDNVTPKTTEQHLIVRSGKSEAEVIIIKDCAVEANYWPT